MSVQRTPGAKGVNPGFRWGPEGETFHFPEGDELAGLAAYKKAVAIGLAQNGAGDMNETERAIAKDISGHVGIRKDAGDAVIVAWYPDPEQAKAIKALMPDGSVAEEDLHMTLLFLGDPDADGTQWDMDLLAAGVKLWSTRQGPCDCEIGGFGRFVAGAEQDVIVALVDCPWIQNLRDSLIENLSYACAIPFGSAVYNPEHGFIPHITLSYVPKGAGTVPTTDDPTDIKIQSIRLAAGAERTSDFPFGNSMYGGQYDEAKAEDPTPFYMAAVENTLGVLAKAGRVISGTNMKKLDEIISHATSIKEAEYSRRAKEEGVVKANEDIEGDLEYGVCKSVNEWQYTFGPLYSPDAVDAHGEWTTSDDLQKAMHAFVQERFDSGNNRLNLQHGDLGDHTVGHMVEFVSWPQEVTLKMRTQDGSEADQTFPAGTVFIGARWDDDSWPLVKSGKIGGFSMGGKAVRMSGGEKELPHMGYKHASRGATPEDVLADAAELAKEREDAALAIARAAGREEGRASERSLLGKALDLFAVKDVPDVHVHLPEQNVTINEAPLPVEEE